MGSTVAPVTKKECDTGPSGRTIVANENALSSGSSGRVAIAASGEAHSPVTQLLL